MPAEKVEGVSAHEQRYMQMIKSLPEGPEKTYQTRKLKALAAAIAGQPKTKEKEESE